MTDGPRILWSQLQIGIVVGLIASVAAVAIFFVDEVRDSFENRYTLYFHTFTTQSLRQRAPVWLAGQPVGHVRELEFQPPTEGLGERLRVELSIRAEAQPFIAEGSVAQVVTAGLLGEAVVNIVPASGEAAVIQSGGELPTASELDPFDIVRRLRTTADSIRPVADLWLEVMRVSRSGTGTLPRLLAAPGEIEELQRQFGQLKGTFDELGAAAAGFSGVLGDDAVQGGLERISSRLTRLADMWKTDDLAPAAPVMDPAFRAQLDLIGERISRITSRVETGRGTIGRLLHDRALANEWLKTRAALEALRSELEARAANLTQPAN